jgi:hypothetical protein
VAHVFTYAVSNGGHIKIGRAQDVLKRIASLQCASPYRLKVICIADGDIEKRTHEHLERENLQRLVGEWFEDTRRLRDELWRLGFKACAHAEEDHRDQELLNAYSRGRDEGFTAGIAHWNCAMGVLNEGAEEHW